MLSIKFIYSGETKCSIFQLKIVRRKLPNFWFQFSNNLFVKNFYSEKLRKSLKKFSSHFLKESCLTNIRYRYKEIYIGPGKCIKRNEWENLDLRRPGLKLLFNSVWCRILLALSCQLHSFEEIMPENVKCFAAIEWKLVV